MHLATVSRLFLFRRNLFGGEFRGSLALEVKLLPIVSLSDEEEAGLLVLDQVGDGEDFVVTRTYKELTFADFATTADLLQFVRDERRRELCFEEIHRWADLRRYGCP